MMEASRRAEEGHLAFPRKKVPAGRKRVFTHTTELRITSQHPLQSRCARQLSLRHASSPLGKPMTNSQRDGWIPFSLPQGEGARRAEEGLFILTAEPRTTTTAHRAEQRLFAFPGGKPSTPSVGFFPQRFVTFFTHNLRPPGIIALILRLSTPKSSTRVAER